MWDILIGTASSAAVQIALEPNVRERLLALFKKKHSILVLGASGVGKTQFLH